MAAASTDKFTEVGNPGTATTLAAPGHTIAGTTFNVVSTSNWPTTTGAIFAVDTYDTSTGLRVPGSYTEWEGVVASATSITGAVLRYGTDQNYSAGSTTRVYIPVASSFLNRLVQGINVEHKQDGTHGVVTATSINVTGNVTAANFVQSGGAAANGWTTGLPAPNTVTALGNHSYSMVFNASDQSGTLSAGMRLRTTRTVAAPTQCTSLNGTTQFYSKSSPSGMTFTNNFVVSAWVKLSSYPSALGVIASRYNGTSGFHFGINASGQVELFGFNGAAANYSGIASNQAVPLNKWVHITAQLDMLTFTATTTTSYIMLDGVDIPGLVSRAGTNPTALVQAGNLEIGSRNSGLNLFPGKLAQVAIYSAKVTQATVLASINQGLAGTETNLISAYNFNNSINDLNANANNLTASGSAVATNADSPFGYQAGGAISSTLDYGIVQSVVFSTNTTVVVQVAEGCTIPTSGGVSAVAYSSLKTPYAFPGQREKWQVLTLVLANIQASGGGSGTVQNPGGTNLNVPVGSWNLDGMLGWQANSNTTTDDYNTGISTSASSFTDSELSYRTLHTSYGGVGAAIFTTRVTKPVTLAAATLYYAIIYLGGVQAANPYLRGAISTTQPEFSRIMAENAYL